MVFCSRSSMLLRKRFPFLELYYMEWSANLLAHGPKSIWKNHCLLGNFYLFLHLSLLSGITSSKVSNSVVDTLTVPKAFRVFLFGS